VLTTFERKVRARPGFVVEHEAWALHGMNGECGEDPEETYRILRDFLEGTILAGHNVQYDARFLRQLQGYRLPIAWHDHHVVDTAALLMPAWLQGEIESCSLGKACAALGVKVYEPAHRALSDILTTVELYRWIMRSRTRDVRMEPDYCDVCGQGGWQYCATCQKDPCR
jgi:DNA polymerase III epsilon subunit-like protein